MVFVVNTLHWGKCTVPLVHALCYCTIELLMVIYFDPSMGYLKRSAQKGTLFRDLLLIIGMQLHIIGLNQAGLTLYGHFPADRLGIMLLAIEGLLGMGMLYFARRLKYTFPVAETQVKKSNSSLSLRDAYIDHQQVYYGEHKDRVEKNSKLDSEREQPTGTSGWSFGRIGNGYIALAAAQGLNFQKRGDNVYRELRSPDTPDIWLCQMGRAAVDGNSNRFIKKCSLCQLIRWCTGQVDHSMRQSTGFRLARTSAGERYGAAPQRL